MMNNTTDVVVIGGGVIGTAVAYYAAKAGRRVDDIDRPQLVVCSVDSDRQAALDAARAQVEHQP